MSHFDKLLQKIESLDNNLRFEEIKKVLEHYGYRMRSPSGGSSHMTFRRQGFPPITIPTHEPIKKVYVQLVKTIVEREENNHEES